MSLANGDTIAGIVDRLTPEFSGIFGPETLDQYVTKSWDQMDALAKVPVFLPLIAERFARERLRALAKVQGVVVSDVPEVLFVCVHNAGRSQMAAALLDWRANGRVHIRSAGSAPVSEINPAVLDAMGELGLDLKKEFPKPLTDEVVRAADVVVTMGCGDACPIYPGKRYLDWELDDPAGQELGEVRRIRDEIDLHVQQLLSELSITAS
jgi:arsenate reductase